MKLFLISLFFSVLTCGQCAMCFRTAESQSRARSDTLNKGIVIMLIPLAAAACAIGYIAYRRRACGNAGTEAMLATPIRKGCE